MTDFGFQGGGGSGGSGSAYPSVNTYADLPSPTTVPNKIYIVLTSTGIWLINRKPAGMYYSNGVLWSYLSAFPDSFNDANFQVYNSADNTKILAFDTSGITTSTIRTLVVPNANGTLALTANTFEEFSFAASDETTVLTAVTSKIAGHWPYNFTMSSVFFGLNVASTSGSFIVDFKDKNGTTIFSTRPTALQGERTSLTNGTQPVLVTTSFAKGDAWSLDIATAGAGATGLKFYTKGIKS
jgi:hypothetical protein